VLCINDSYNVPARRAALHAVCGPPLSAGQRLRALLQGRPVGSPRVPMVDTSSAEVNALLVATADVKWANFERTSAGHIVRFRVLLETWAIPFHGEARVERTAADRCDVHFGPHRLSFAGSPNAIEGLLNYLRP
jgi:hypothetical protein